MAMIKISKVQFASQFSGLGNNQTIDYSQAIPSVSKVSGGSDTQIITVPVNNTNTLNRIQIRLNGLETNTWRPITGQFEWYNNATVSNASQLFVITPATSGNNIVLSVTRINQSASTITLSALTFDVKVRVMSSLFQL